MSATATTEDVVRNAFDEVAFLIGGVAVAREWGDRQTWRVMRRLDRVRRRTLARLGKHDDRPVAAHPAVEEFLRLGRDGGQK